MINVGGQWFRLYALAPPLKQRLSSRIRFAPGQDLTSDYIGDKNPGANRGQEIELTSRGQRYQRLGVYDGDVNYRWLLHRALLRSRTGTE